MEKEEFVFFWDGIYSQWHRCRFRDQLFIPKEYHKVIFNTAEQFMMFNKAIFFNDIKTANKILKSTSPKEQKALGREVSNFNVQRWNSVVKDIIYKGNYLKFTQNKDLLKPFLATYPKTLVEASPYDPLYGIGLAADDKRAQNRSTWQGKNWLGETLTQLRNDLLQDKRFTSLV